MKDDVSDDDYHSDDDEVPTPFIMACIDSIEKVACIDSYEKGIDDVKLFVELHRYHKYIKIDVVNNESDMTLKDMVCQVGGGYLDNRFNPEKKKKKFYHRECNVPKLIIYNNEDELLWSEDNLKICELGKYIIGIAKTLIYDICNGDTYTKFGNWGTRSRRRRVQCQSNQNTDPNAESGS